VEARAASVRDTLAQAGIALSSDRIVSGAESRTRAYLSVDRLLRQPSPPTALYSTSDTGAISALWAARSLNLRVPGDLAIVGTGNIAEGSITQPALSTIGAVHQPFAEIAEMLFQRLSGAALDGGRRMVIPWTFFPRGTI
jgi:DNA-binding LacI/PurR family transcriptional regulator